MDKSLLLHLEPIQDIDLNQHTKLARHKKLVLLMDLVPYMNRALGITTVCPKELAQDTDQVLIGDLVMEKG